ncbi:MAG: hypothetical protein V3V78_03040 [Candidatus Woesearchaeota archaeon]
MKAIKKIVALTTGAIMLGATITGAMAADLADYPAPFVEGCSFSGAIVVGEKAAAEDVVGAVDIASALAVSGTTTTSSGTAASVTVSGEAYKIEKSTNKLNLGEDVADVATKIDADDLPTVLADGSYTNDEGKDFDYEQTIDLSSKTFEAFTDSDINDDDPTIGLHYDDQENVMNYTLEFTEAAESDVSADDELEDFEDTTLVILGNTYDIVEATNQSGGYFEIMGGAVKDVMEQGEVKSFSLNDKEYEVEVTYIGETSGISQVKMKVNGEVTNALQDGDTHKLADGTQIGIREILEEEAGEVTADQVEFYIGAEKITLENGEELQLNDDDVDEFQVVISNGLNTGGEYELEEINLIWNSDDETFIVDGSSVVMPGLESVKLSYEGLSTPAEEIIEIEPDSDEVIQLNIPIKGGVEQIPLFNDTGDGTYTVGDEDDLLYTTAGTSYTFVKDVHMYMVVTNTDSYESALVKVTAFDDDDGCDFEEVTSGATDLKRDDAEEFEVLDITFTVGTCNSTSDSVDISTTDPDFAGDLLYTEQGLIVNLPITGGVYATGATIVFEEEGDDSDVTAGAFEVVVKGNQSGSAINMQVDSINMSRIGEVGDSDQFVYYIQDGESEVTTKAILDEGPDEPTVTIYYPGGESYGNLYVAESEAGFGTVAGVSGEAVCKVAIPPAKLDSEVSSASAQNLIVVGGPCANTVAADVLGVASSVPECLAGFEEGKAMVKMIDTGAGKTAMLVAGYSAMDTRRATRVVANAGDYALSGDEVEVSGTTLSDISVSAVSE